ncbi:MAG: DUF1622 domain-containing protein [Candidatus Eremiobacteraeota bacterium]|nr:DUF1622 domain-containing protein [Candidatus Eremiobacteraeota bacterium]MBV8338504.1 DUF1622 domain-containing protein [Candidatus Eremiobacteraeota bacterium]MBV8594815.1 DUF1622 domain-containing protein [Candidatus Eremiobacteraeota bacterium]
MEVLTAWAEGAAQVIDLGAVVLAVAASLDALIRAAVVFFRPHEMYRTIRWMLGRRLTLVLELLIASDIIRTAINPSWLQLGQLGATVVLRELINYTLNRDIKEAGSVKTEAATNLEK